MDYGYIREIEIKKVRHLSGIRIPVLPEGEERFRHIVLTGKNGSGKTSVLDALSTYLESALTSERLETYRQAERVHGGEITRATGEYLEKEKQRHREAKAIVDKLEGGLHISFSGSESTMRRAYAEGDFVLAYFKTERVFKVDISKHVEKVTLKQKYGLEENPRKEFVKYLVDKKVSEALYRTKGQTAKADALNEWFLGLENLMREICSDPKLVLDFNIDRFEFRILEDGREPFDFNSMSSGYAAILDIVVGIIMRMEAHGNGSFSFTMPGIVLIDELETHLHYELQKRILPFLTTVFPNIQFIVSTHSAFILSSIENAVIYDLETRTLVENGLSALPYDGIIEGYFNVSKLSNSLRQKFARYKALVGKAELSAQEAAELKRLEFYLDEIPDYLALDFATEYQQIKLDHDNREGV